MKIFAVRHRTFLALVVCCAIGVGGMTLAQQNGKGQVKSTQLSQRDIIEKLDGKDASATKSIERQRLIGQVLCWFSLVFNKSDFQ